MGGTPARNQEHAGEPGFADHAQLTSTAPARSRDHTVPPQVRLDN
jgi:hypothetical protein